MRVINITAGTDEVRPGGRNMFYISLGIMGFVAAVMAVLIYINV
jgi:hypothetical protein